MNYELTSFEDIVYADLEKAFSARIACCDKCRDDFLKSWPWAYNAEDHDFQRRGIDLQWFYDSGRVKDLWTIEEYWELMAELGCPRCYEPLTGAIWAYELPFDARDLDDEIYEVSELAKATPFLLLEHDFCKNVYSAIKAAAMLIQPIIIDQHLYRARVKTANLNAVITEFDFPPARFVGEGRYNHAGGPVLYIASDLETCKAETRNENILTIKFKTDTPLKIFDLTSDFRDIREHEELLICLAYSALVSAPQDEEGFHKPHYTVSRFVADCAKSAGFDAIKYPSTRSAYGSFNLVIINQELTLKHIASDIEYIDL